MNTAKIMMMNDAISTEKNTAAHCVFGAGAAMQAKMVANPLAHKYPTLCVGDIIVFPTTVEEFENQLAYNPKTLHLFLLVEVKRNGVSFVTKIDKNTMCRSSYDKNHLLVHSNSQVAQDFMRGASLYDAFLAFVGKQVKVVAKNEIAVRSLKRGAMRNIDGHFAETDFCLMEKPFYEMEYVFTK